MKILRGPLSIPRSVEASLPRAAPRLSSIMGSIADAIPELPVTLPILGSAGARGMPRPSQMFKGIEASLPDSMPSFANPIASVEQLIGLGGNSTPSPAAEAAKPSKSRSGVVPLYFE